MKKLVIFIIFLLNACDSNDTEVRPYPRVRTYDVTEIAGGGASLHGVITTSSVEVLDHGFVWSTYGNPTWDKDQKISFGNKSAPGKYDHKIVSGLLAGQKYYVKAYAKSGKYIVYGEVVKFIAL